MLKGAGGEKAQGEQGEKTQGASSCFNVKPDALQNLRRTMLNLFVWVSFAGSEERQLSEPYRSIVIHFRQTRLSFAWIDLQLSESYASAPPLTMNTAHVDRKPRFSRNVTGAHGLR